jgi:hypothetical protein
MHRREVGVVERTAGGVGGDRLVAAAARVVVVTVSSRPKRIEPSGQLADVLCNVRNSLLTNSGPSTRTVAR